MQAISALITLTTLLTLTLSAPISSASLAQRLAPKIIQATPQDFADPAAIQLNNTWYAFGTNSLGRNVQIATSAYFTAWTVLPRDAMPTLPTWVDHSHPQVWAPHVSRLDNGSFVLYYSARVPGQAHHCVGAAVSPNITGPYTPLAAPLACPLAAGGAIDASGFRDVDGQRYLVYKVDGNSIGHGGLCGNTVAPIVATPIMLQKVGADGVTLLGNAVSILDRSAVDGPLVEAPSLVRTRGGKYLLFYSSSCFATRYYDVAYAVADGVAGPYTKIGPFAVTGTDGLFAPGGATVAEDGQHMVFHAGHVGARQMFTARIEVDEVRGVVYTV